MPVLEPAELDFFRENGYTVVRNAVPQENLDAVVDLIWRFLDRDPSNPDTWYSGPKRHGGMVSLYQHQALWDNRQYPRVHEAFSEVLGTDKLWVTIDRVNMKPPVRPDLPGSEDAGFTHWDTDTRQYPRPLAVQGVLCLTDTTADMGGFQCVPELFKTFDEWVKTQPADRNPYQPDLTGFQVTPIEARAGDLIIWNRFLAHGNGRNVSDRPRLAQYISMFPAPEDNEELRQERIRIWRERVAPNAPWATPDPTGWEQKHAETAKLTPLGRKLLGLDPW